MTKKANDDEGSKGGAISNVPDGNVVMKYVQAVENLHGDLATEKSESMIRCKVIHTDIKQVFKDAKKEAGLNKKGLMAVIEERALEAKLAAVGGNLEGDDAAAHATYKLALENLGPLGEAALKQAA
jgi:hypothetical protein